jgi:type VI secretion system secreted protein VgrG
VAEATQEHRAIAVETPLGPDALLLRTMSGTETVSRLFEYELELLSEDPEIDGNDLLGENLSVRMMQLSGDTRYFNGYVSAFRSVPGSAKFSRYQISMRPWLWFLTRISDCRIFQETTIPDVVKQVFQDRGFSDYKFNLSGTYPTRAYIVQFRETDFNFISRLLEFEGVYYYFEHENGKHTMVLCDSYSAHEQGVPYEVEYFPPDEGVVRECLHSWSVSKSLQPTSYLLDAFNFESPTTSLRARRSVQRAHANGELEVYDPEDTYLQASDGDGYAQKRIEELASQFETVTPRTTNQIILSIVSSTSKNLRERIFKNEI